MNSRIRNLKTLSLALIIIGLLLILSSTSFSQSSQSSQSKKDPSQPQSQLQPSFIGFGFVSGFANHEGYKNPSLGFDLAGAYALPNLSIIGDLYILHNPKIDADSGMIISFESLVRYRFDKGLIIEGGGEINKLLTKSYNKLAARMIAGIGAKYKGLLLTGDYLGRDSAENKGQGFRLKGEYFFNRIRIFGQIRLLKFDSPFAGKFGVWGQSVEGGVDFIWRAE